MASDQAEVTGPRNCGTWENRRHEPQVLVPSQFQCLLVSDHVWSRVAFFSWPTWLACQLASLCRGVPGRASCSLGMSRFCCLLCPQTCEVQTWTLSETLLRRLTLIHAKPSRGPSGVLCSGEAGHVRFFLCAFPGLIRETGTGRRRRMLPDNHRATIRGPGSTALVAASFAHSQPQSAGYGRSQAPGIVRLEPPVSSVASPFPGAPYSLAAPHSRPFTAEYKDPDSRPATPSSPAVPGAIPARARSTPRASATPFPPRPSPAPPPSC